MVKDIEYGSSDKREWYKNHTLTEEQKQKLIEEKINKAKQYLNALVKAKAIN
jgi:hypothetical protein